MKDDRKQARFETCLKDCARTGYAMGPVKKIVLVKKDRKKEQNQEKIERKLKRQKKERRKKERKEKDSKKKKM